MFGYVKVAEDDLKVKEYKRYKNTIVTYAAILQTTHKLRG